MVPWPTCYEIVAKYGGDKAASGKVAIVTGSNTGIGLETAAALWQAGATVVMACRNVKAAQEAVKSHRLLSTASADRLMIMQLDLGSLKSVNAFAKEFAAKFKNFDILVNNAGLGYQSYAATADGFEQTFGVNHVGHFHLTNLLLPLMNENGRIVIVSSESHRDVSYSKREDIVKNLPKHFNPSEAEYSMHYAYGISKLANVLHANELSKRLQASGRKITVNSLHPGSLIYTSFGRSFLLQAVLWIASFVTMNVEQGAATTVYACIAPELNGVTAKYFENQAERPSTKLSKDEELMSKLWTYSEELVRPRASL